MIQLKEDVIRILSKHAKRIKLNKTYVLRTFIKSIESLDYETLAKIKVFEGSTDQAGNCFLNSFIWENSLLAPYTYLTLTIPDNVLREKLFSWCIAIVEKSVRTHERELSLKRYKQRRWIKDLLIQTAILSSPLLLLSYMLGTHTAVPMLSWFVILSTCGVIIEQMRT